MTKIRSISSGEYYHVFNRGTYKVNIFREKIDYARFLFLVLYYQSAITFPHIGRLIRDATLSDGFPVELDLQEKIIKERVIELTSFCLMPNHFHLLLKTSKAQGIGEYLQRIQVAYTMYFNAKYKSSGHVFQGRYKTVQIKDDRQLIHLSAYIHQNPHELKEWSGKEFNYPWSSLQDYTAANRWGGLLATDIIASRFAGTLKSNYADFVKTSPAKMFYEEFKRDNQ